MGECFHTLTLRLAEFQFDYYDFNSDKQATDLEILTTNRIIKKEVIDSADLIEQIAKVLIVMGHKVDLNQDQQERQYRHMNANMKKLAKMMNLDETELTEEMEQTPATATDMRLSSEADLMGDSYNVRKSPFYQQMVIKQKKVKVASTTAQVLQDFGRRINESN